MGQFEAQGGSCERLHLETDGLLGRGGDLQPMGAVPAISEKAIGMIVGFEVGSQAAYERLYRHPVWPGGASGVTVGIGYDLGYVSRPSLDSDWGRWLARANIELLGQACGVKGKAAQDWLPRLAAIGIPFASAIAVFRGVTLVQMAALTTAALPNAARLSPDSFGALVSLVYNRGASFRLPGGRYLEMRQIRDDIAAGDFARVPSRILGMKRIWQDEPDMRGLLRRRDLEAALFEEGLGAA
jgi:hypothetical protein